MTKPLPQDSPVTPAADWPTVLLDLRARHGWTQAQLAEQIGAAPTTISRYESGRATPTRVYRAALGRFLGSIPAQPSPEPQPTLVTPDGFAPGAVVRDPATGCEVWQHGCNQGGIPVAEHDGRRRRTLRRLVWERAGRPRDRAIRLGPTCGNPRCLALAHLAPYVAEPMPARRPKRVHPLRPLLAAHLPATKPMDVSDREWQILTGIRDGRSLAALAADVGVSRQRVNAIARAAYLRLTASAPPGADQSGRNDHGVDDAPTLP